MECRAGTIYLRASLKWIAGLYGFFFLSGSVVAGTVRLKWWGGGGVRFFLLSLLAVSFICGWMPAVGFLCYNLRFSLVNLWFFHAVLCFESY